MARSKVLEGNLVKKAYSKSKYTEKQLQDLKQCADLETGYIHFMKSHMWIQHPTKGSMKFDMFDYQKGLVDTYHSNRFAIAMLPRQTGKTTCAAAYLIWYAMLSLIHI